MIIKDKPNKVKAELQVKLTCEFYDDEATAETVRAIVEDCLNEIGDDVDVRVVRKGGHTK